MDGLKGLQHKLWKATTMGAEYSMSYGAWCRFSTIQGPAGKKENFSFALRLSEKLPLTVRFEATVHAEASSFILLGNWLKLFIKNCIHKTRCVVIHQIKHRLQHEPAGCIIRIHICLLQCNQFRWVRGKKYHNVGELSVPCRNTKSSNFGMWRQKSSQPD